MTCVTRHSDRNTPTLQHTNTLRRGTVSPRMSDVRLAVILAGGTGERFWPLSDAKRPKQLLKLIHPEQTLLDAAIERIAPLFTTEHIYVSTGKDLAQTMQEACKAKVLAEPAKRNTLGAICWIAASLLAERPGENVTLAILTADHKIDNIPAFRATVQTAMDAAERESAIVTIGIKPTRPETGFGYIELEAPTSPSVQRAARFCEKPTLDLAEAFIDLGNYAWNSGMFFFSLDTLMRELSAAQPEAHALTMAMAKALGDGQSERAATLFEELPSVSFDYGVMERAKNVLVVAGEFEWDDVGAWDSLNRAFEPDAEGNVVLGEVSVIDAKDCVLVNRSEHKVGVLGVSDLVVVVSEDGILVCRKNRAQEVRKIAGKFNE